MWGAAPRRYRRLLLCSVAAMGLVVMPAAHARDAVTTKRMSFPELWALEVTRGNLHLLTDKTAQAAVDADVNTLLVDPTHMSKHQRRRVAQVTKRFGFRKLALPHRATRSLGVARAHCRKAKRRHPSRPCTLRSSSLLGA